MTQTEEIKDELQETENELDEGGTSPVDTPSTEPVPDELLEVLINSRIDELVAKEVEKRLKGQTPKRRTANTQAVDQAAFNKMSYKERLKLFKTSPTQYQKLVGGNR